MYTSLGANLPPKSFSEMAPCWNSQSYFSAVFPDFSTVGSASRLGSVTSLSSDASSLLSQSLGSSDTRPSVIGGRSDNHRQRGDGHDGGDHSDKYVLKLIIISCSEIKIGLYTLAHYYLLL